MTEKTDTLSGDAGLELPEFDAPPDDPIALLGAWVAGATERGVREPLALALATVDAAGHPSSRIVLLKGLDRGELLFSGRRASRKGRDVAAVPRAAGTLYWRETLQQVTLAGPVEELTDAESDALFAARPRGAQATVAVTRQGEEAGDPAALAAAARALAEGSEPIARPEGWGGYRLAPDHIEFWHGSRDRMHRRLGYVLEDGVWVAGRLQP